MLKGFGVSSGIGIGKVVIKDEDTIKIKRSRIQDVSLEKNRLHKALAKSKIQIEELRNHVLQELGHNEASIFDAHLMILEDPEIFGQAERTIEKNLVNAEGAIQEVVEAYIRVFEEMDDPYIRERIEDLKDVANRVLHELMGNVPSSFINLDGGSIIVAKDLTPSDTAQLNKGSLEGFITEIGSKTSHTAIMARTMGIPAVVGVKGLMKKIQNGDMIVLDGDSGEIHINPSEETKEKYTALKARKHKDHKELESLIGIKTITRDGLNVELGANIGSPKDLEAVLQNDAEGIGLFRSEFLYMGREDFPSEEEQFEAYKKVAEELDEKPIIIRTLDIGGDKELSYLSLPKEMNPFLGYRAIRISLDRIDLFMIQLRAILRASKYGNVKIMFPMISSVEEVREAKKILGRAKDELRDAHIAFHEDIEVGIMIEIPSAAIISDILAREVDFFSIGTNDLIQYTIAVDRINEGVAHLYSPLHPAVLRLIQRVIDNGHEADIWVGMCGEATEDPRMIPLLIGMGLDEFSMSPGSILKARKLIKDLDSQECKKVVKKVLSMATSKEIGDYIGGIYSLYKNS